MQRLRYGGADLILDEEYVSQIAVEALRPEIESIFHSHQVAGDANAVSGPPDRPFQHSFYAQFAADLSGIPALPLEAKSNAALGHPQPVDPR